MTIVSIILIVIILVLVIVYVTRPLFTSQDETVEINNEGSLDQLYNEYNATLERIRELDFDFNLGKLTVEDHNVQRNELLSLAASLRAQLKAHETASSTTATS